MTFIVRLSLRPIRLIVSIRIFAFEPEGLLPALNLEIQNLSDRRPEYSSVNAGAFQLELSSAVGRNRWFEPSQGRVEQVKKRAPYAMVRTTPPSTRKEAPVVPDACSEQT
jgi:hypothetical protein